MVCTLLCSNNSILIYGGGTTQVTSEINTYEILRANRPIQGSVMVTHDKDSKIDDKSFKMGEQPLEVVFVKNVPMSTFNPLVLSIYQFTIKGMPSGEHILPPITVKVNGTVYQAPPITIQVNP